jgi:hypothetical protein
MTDWERETGIDIHSTIDKPYSGIIYEFWLKDVSQKQNLPEPGKWAANTSVAWVKSTDEIGTLDDEGWKWN